ncbi:MAG: valine--tRNA ligase [Longimicrobiaceae bacterium]
MPEPPEMSEPLSPRYNPSEVEERWYGWWEERGLFSPAPAEDGAAEREPYTVVIPPPNVTATLHMGHGLNSTIQDVLVRWRRMQGRRALWVPGTDHAGIATQNVVERQLAAEGASRQELGPEAFVARVWEWVGQTGGSILKQLRAIGCSCDWSRARFTLDPELSRAVSEVFVRLHEKGLVYRGEYIINWCPRCLTALSNEEAEAREEPGKLYKLRYPLGPGVEGAGLPRLPDGRPYLVVATTRPETVLGDTGVAVHPDDQRYRRLVGVRAELPFTGRTIPIVADDQVDPGFGTGAVKVTPAHDLNDFELGRRHGLESVNVLSEDARTNENAPERFRGLDRFEARERVVEAFREEGLLEEVGEYVHAVPHCYRCGAVVEPRLSLQWFVKMEPLAGPALASYREGRLRFTPERWGKVYEHWLANIRDWCISRQLWWGHRIPAWYGPDGELFVARSEEEAAAKAGTHYGEPVELGRDADVLDTWFSSWLWPFSVFGWPRESADLRTFYPTHALSTAPEILFFWVARMVMAGLEFTGREPFRDVYLHGTVRDHLGRKMSKSLGNGIDPLEVVRLYGADALRYTVLSGAAAGSDILLNHQDLEEAFAPGRNFANKVWNVGRFALSQLEREQLPPPGEVEGQRELADRWILSRLSAASGRATRALEQFRFHDYTETVYHFFWAELADWYLELVKPRLAGERGEASRCAARLTLAAVMEQALRLLHPVMPFLSEELWQRLPGGWERAESIMKAPWPDPDATPSDPGAERSLEELMELISAVRTLRGEYNVPAGELVPVTLRAIPPSLEEVLEQDDAEALRRLARVRSVERIGEGRSGAGAHAVLRSGAELFIPLEGVVDLDRERRRLSGEITRLEGQVLATRGKLGNEKFLARAPGEVVEREREKLKTFTEQRDKLGQKLRVLEGV